MLTAKSHLIISLDKLLTPYLNWSGFALLVQVRRMVAEDEPDILKTAEISLAKWGSAVDAFTDPVGSLAYFWANPMDIR